MANRRRKKPAYRRGQGYRWSMVAISLIVLAFAVVIKIGGLKLEEKKRAYAEKEAVLTNLIQQEEERSDEIARFKAYTGSLRYYEDEAKDKLGMVYKGELIFQEK